MKHSLPLSGAASIIALLAAMPASAQDTDVAAELAQMRAQMAAMAERIESLEAELEQAEAAPSVPVPANPALDVNFKAAPEISDNSGFTFKPRGRLNLDAGFIDAPGSTGREDGFGSDARRVRLGVSGDIPGGFGYKVEVDFAGDEVALTDAILTYETGGTTLTVGQHNNFQSLEELSSSLHTSFIERAAFTDAFGFTRRLGVSAEFSSGDVLVQGGVFSDNTADLPSKEFSLDGRAVYAPRLGDNQLHLGASVHYRDLEEDGAVRYRQRPLVAFTNERFINTGFIDADSEFGVGTEAAIIAGPFHAAGEAYWQTASRTLADDANFFGGYVEAGLFLTGGDTRGYKGGKFDRVKPTNPVGSGGLGAWQVNARFDHLDLNDADILGGTQDSYQLSLIWTPTAYTRFLINYARNQYDDAVFPAEGGDTSYGVDALGVRAQIDF